MATPGDRRLAFGRRGEATAEAYLSGLGYRTLARRFRLRNGELDLVMADGRTIVFVEVRTRGSDRGGDPLESVGATKRYRTIRAARVFLSIRRLHDRPCRFDVIGVRDTGEGRPAIDHRPDAFRDE